MSDTILSMNNVHTYIEQHHILQGISLNVEKGGATILLGRNGAGKSTTLRTIMGLTPSSKGEIKLTGERVENKKTYDIAKKGVGFVPEDNAVLFTLTVEENLKLSILKKNEKSEENIETILDLFPHLKKFWKTKAGLLSGGQKQMLAIARVFVGDHKLLLIDEPSKGLAPIVVDQLGESLLRIRDTIKVILVEQNFNLAKMVGRDFYILDEGKVVHTGLMENLAQDKEMKQKYLGI